jgi:hypothetical protein
MFHLHQRGIEVRFSQPRASMANDITRLRRLAECDLTQPPDLAVQDLKQLAVTVMHTGSMEDWMEISDILGEDFLRKTLREYPTNRLFAEKPWVYWNRRLFGWDAPVPPMPKRSSSS